MTTRWSGSGVAPGAAVGASWRADRPASGATGRLNPMPVQRAFHAVAAELDQIARRAKVQDCRTASDIVDVAALIARDITLIEAARDAAAASDDPLRAVRDVIESYATVMEGMSDPTLRERAADIRQVGRRVIDRLARGAAGAAAPPPHGFVLIAEEIGPADLLEHLGRGLAAAVAVRGGATSHAAIVARSLGLPLVTDVAPELLDLPDGTRLLVDAGQGLVVAHPHDSQSRAATERSQRRHSALTADRGRPHVTADGQPFTLLANVATDVEARIGIDAGAQGIGLLRTELPFLKVDGWPSEADHRRALRPIFAAAGVVPVTVRLLDFTDDKIPPFVADGGRVGLEALLASPEALAAQLRAVLDLGQRAGLRIMIPMLTGVAQLRAVRAAVAAVAANLNVPLPPVGVMIETVAATEAIDQLTEMADFLSLGTNDLTGQILGLDRRDPCALPDLTAHPNVLRLISRTVTAAALHNRPVSVCGDAAAHPTTLPLLLGTGLRAFSVAGARIDQTRYLLRRLDTGQCAALLVEALGRDDTDGVLALVADRTEVTLP